MLTLATHMDRQRYNVSLAFVEMVGPYATDIPVGLPVYNLDAKRVRYAGLPLLRLCWQIRPRIVISTQAHLNILLSAVRGLLPPGTRVVLREAISLSQVVSSNRRRALLSKLYCHADRVVAPSHYVAEDLERNFSVPATKITQIYNPVDMDRVRKHISEAENCYNPALRNLVAVGRLVHQKGFDLLLGAIANLEAELPSIHLTILGDGPDGPQLQNLARQLGIESSVTFAGFQMNPYPYYKYADLAISSSRYEGLPNVVLEAMACGTNVVATACPGGTRELIDDGQTGLLAPPDSIEGLAQSIKVALDRGLPITGETLQRHIESRYGVNQIVRQYEAMLDQLLAS